MKYGEVMLHLELDPKSTSQTALIRCSGRIVFHQEAKDLADTVRPLLDRHQYIVLDLGAVRDMDSCGLGTLVALHLSAREKNRSLTLMNPGRAVAELLELTRLNRELNIAHGGDALTASAA